MRLKTFNCKCVQVITGSWADIGTDRVCLFGTSNALSALRSCSVCGGTGKKETKMISWHLRTKGDNAPILDIYNYEDGIIAAPFLPVLLEEIERQANKEDFIRSMDILCRLREYFGMSDGNQQPEEFVDTRMNQAARDFNLNLEVY